jgi:predicted metalloprotease with PDZ domain
MNSVSPYDWKKFFRDRLDFVGTHAPLGGIEGSGWKLVYDETPNAHIQANEHTDGEINFTYSLGMTVTRDGYVRDVLPGTPVAAAGLAPGMRVLHVNGKNWSAEALHDAVRRAKRNPAPIELHVENAGYGANYEVKYNDGESYPHLIRDTSKPDLLSDILRPLTGSAAPPQK